MKNGFNPLHFLPLAGNFRYPLEKAAPIALKTVKEFVEYAMHRGDRAPELIQFFLFQEEAYVCYVKALSILDFACPVFSERYLKYP